MSVPVSLAVVLAATYGLTNGLLSLGLAVAWHAGLARCAASANTWLTLRLLPAGGAALCAVGVVLPSFLLCEPAQRGVVPAVEQGGPALIALMLLATLIVGAGLVRAWRARRATDALLLGPLPLVAVVGSWRPRIIASPQVRSACTPEEFGQVIAHEIAHVRARDNLKLLLQVAAPDLLAWLPTGAALTARWRAAAERAADEDAAGADRGRRLTLASALVKVARLAPPAARADRLPALLMPVAADDDVAGRVRALLGPPPTPVTRNGGRWVALGAALAPVIAVPLYGPVHEMLELLVALGR